MAIVTASSLIGAKAAQGDGIWPKVSVTGTQSQMILVCAILMAIIVIWVGRRLLRTQWTTPRRATETLRRMLREQIESGDLDPVEAERIARYHTSSVREAALMSQSAASSSETPENQRYVTEDDVEGPSDGENYIYELIDRELARPVTTITSRQRQLHQDRLERVHRARETYQNLSQSLAAKGKGKEFG